MNNKNLVIVTKEDTDNIEEFMQRFTDFFEYISDSFKKKHLELTKKYKEKYGEDPEIFFDKCDYTWTDIDDPRRLQFLMAHTVVLCDMGIDLCRFMSIKSAFKLAEMVNYFSGLIDAQNEVLILKRAKARANANKRHTENHAIKSDALKYYAENIGKFRSMDNAAEQIAGNIVNAKFRTVRQWIAEYHKNIRSASTT